MKTRIYKYRLTPTDTQKKLLNEVGSTSRFLWNRCVAQVKYVQHEVKHGRRGNIEKEYKDLFTNKQLVGMRAKAVTDLATEKNISKEEALKLFVAKSTTKDTTIVTRKNGTKAKRWSTNHLAWKYAVEKVNSQREHLLSPSILSIWTGIQAKWIDFGNLWDKGISKAPRFKKYGQISSIQKQIGKTTNWIFGDKVDLSFCGSPCLEDVAVIAHRPLPTGTTIKQIALVKDTLNNWFIAIFIEAEDSVFARNFNRCEGKIVGIDPGVKAAMTTSDGRVIQPNGISKQDKQERKLKKLQRKLDRQLRLNNPHCFDEKGRWKRGQKISFRSKRMLQTGLEIADIKRYFKDAKADYYHNVAIDMLNKYDTIAIGDAKMHNLRLGKGAQKRAVNERTREHSIADFKMKLKDKASLSLTSKAVCEIVERNTTRTCSVCGYIKNDITLSDRTWDCPQCKTHHDRDVNAAINIKNVAVKELCNGNESDRNTNRFSVKKKATVAQAVSERKISKVRKSSKTNASIEDRATETISPQGDGVVVGTSARGNVIDQSNVSARTSQMVVTELPTQVDVSADTSSPPEKAWLSQSQY